MPDHKLDRTCSKCQATAPTPEAIERWHRGSSGWLCDVCYEPAAAPPRRRPARGLHAAMLLALAVSLPPSGR